MALWKLFVELAQPDENGYSRPVEKKEFVKKYKILDFKNGLSWGRRDGALAQIYEIVVKKKKGEIYSIKLNGFKEDPVKKKAILNYVKKALNVYRCPILFHSSNLEIDHKDGRAQGFNYNDVISRVSDFQILSKPANCAKREACKICRNTNIRFDAKKIGYPISYIKGGAKYNIDEGGCVGCFWYDVRGFQKETVRRFLLHPGNVPEEDKPLDIQEMLRVLRNKKKC